MDKRKASDLFWVTFSGKFVEILAKYKTTEEVPLTIHGFLLDVDDDFYYIGDNPIEANAAVRKTDVVFMSVTEEAIDPAVEILEQMSVPKREEDAN